MSVPKKVSDRIASRLKNFQSVLAAQKARDVSEADTVTIIKDLLSEVFGYDKYSELTSEHAIRGTYCDLAVKIDGRLAFLIEVKAIGLELKDAHTKQAVDYAANQGCEWVILSNGVDWILYHVLFRKPIDKQEVARVNLLTANPKSEKDLEMLYLMTREGFAKSALAEYRDRMDATSRYMLAAILCQSESIVSAIRREVRRTSDLIVEPEVIVQILREQVIKRDAIEGPEAEAAMKRLQKASQKVLRKASSGEDDPAGGPEAAAEADAKPEPGVGGGG